MKKHLLALALAAAASGAFAADQTVTFTGSTANFGSTLPLLDGGSDLITFDGVASGTYDVTLTLSSQFTSALTVSLNGVTAPELGNFFGVFRFYGLQTTDDAPFSLTVAGTPSVPSLASYAGTLSVVAVPEPETYAMLLAGLGAMGFMRRRRQG